MRQLKRVTLITLIVSTAQNTIAQNCTIESPLGQQGNSVLVDSEVLPNGDIIAVLGQQHPLRHVVAVRLSSTGQIVWTRPIIPTNPNFRLIPSDVEINSNGSMLIYGKVDHTTYTNLFGVQLDQSGTIEWARLFMTNWSYFSNSKLKTLADVSGGYVLETIDNSFHQIDMNGVPTGLNVRYTSSGSFVNLSDMIVEADGSMTICGIKNNVPLLMHTDPMGQPLWTFHYTGLSLEFSTITKAANGDHLVAGQGPSQGTTTLARFSATGTMIWAKAYSLGEFGGWVKELPSGDIIFTVLEYSWDPVWNTLEEHHSVILTDQNGLPTSAKSASAPSLPVDMVYATMDSVIMAGNMQNATATYPFVSISDDLATWGCGLTDTTVTHVDINFTNQNIDTLTAGGNLIKTWTMSLYDSPTGQMDVVALLSGSIARPGFNLNYYGSAVNVGTTPSGQVDATLTFDPVLVFDTAHPPGYVLNGNQVNWTGLPSLQAVEAAGISAAFTVPADTALLGDTLETSLAIQVDSVELTLTNNVSTFQQIIVGSYDPNDKLVSPESVFEPGVDSLLNYTIRFQNTGTDTAFTVVIVDTLPEFVSVGSFREGPASHPYTYELNAQGMLTFTFDNILLPDSNVNEPASHGLVSFTVRPDENLAIGTQISNSADIFFDFNPPVRTPPAIVSYGMIVGIEVVLAEEQLQLYPVPVSDALTAVLPDDFRAQQLTLTTLDGRVIQTTQVQQVTNRLSLDVSALANGAYVMSLVDEDGKRLFARFVKE